MGSAAVVNLSASPGVSPGMTPTQPGRSNEPDHEEVGRGVPDWEDTVSMGRQWLPPKIFAAHNQRRLVHGPGPWYTRRILPDIKPRRRKELLDKKVASMWDVDNNHEKVAHGIVVPPGSRERLMAGNGTGDGAVDWGPFAFDMVTRARSAHLQLPEHVLGGWAAAPFLELPYWADAAPVLMLGPGSRGSLSQDKAARYPERAVVRDLPDGTATVCPDPMFPTLRTVTSEVSLAECLRQVKRGSSWWDVPLVANMAPEEVKAVQVIDAFRQCSYITAESLLSAGSGVIDRYWLTRVMRLSDNGAQSPRETLLRLYVRDLLPAGLNWRSQLNVPYRSAGSGGETRRTWFDLGCEEICLGLYYDGKFHGEPSRKHKDFQQIQDLKDRRWEVIRVDRDLMRNVPAMLEQISNAIDRGLRQAGFG